MTTLAPSAAPTCAAKVWADASNLYLEFPCPPGGTPHIVKLPLAEQGLSKGLSLLKKQATVPNGTTRLVEPVKAKPVYSDQQRQTVRDILRKKGML